MKRISLLLCLSLRWMVETAWPQAPLILENDHIRYSISPEGKNLGFVDVATSIDYLRPNSPSACALVRVGGKEIPVTSVQLANRLLTLRFGSPDRMAVLKVEPQPSSIQLTVESVQVPGLESLVFLNVPLSLKGTPEEPFGACAFSLNLKTRVDQLPALQSELKATCYPKFGVVGAKVAIIGEPMGRMLDAFKTVLSEAEEMPVCKVAGPWAPERPFNHGSYLFNFGALTEATVGDWIGMVKGLGFSQVDNHGGSDSFFRFGDFELNRQKWPEGWETYRRIVARLHEAGIGSIFHTYAFFIDKHSKYVSPVPDPRLDAFRMFTLADALDANSSVIQVNEPTAGMSTVTGFFEQNSVVLHLGDELVAFSGASTNPPWRFTGVKRGVLGTRAGAHAKGTQARHLKECFGLFVPNPESSLFEEIAARHAEIVNQCGFDGLYLDAIDGSSILRRPDECWYWADKFVFEIQKRLNKPVGMEMSAMWHHFWQYRTRWQAWDYPQRGQQRFIDLHAQSVNGGLLLPLHLGWWNFQSFDPPQVDPVYPDTVEYLGAKMIGWNAGVSLTGAVDQERLKSIPLFRRATEMLHTYEELRQANAIDEVVKARLRQPGQQYTLTTNKAGGRQFRSLESKSHVAAVAEPWTCSWSLTNPSASQPVKFRLEALMSVDRDDQKKSKMIGDLSGSESEQWKASQAQGVTFSLAPNREDPNLPMAELAALNAGQVPRNAAWSRLERRFNPPLNLKEQQALGVWIEGDGLGEIIAFRLESPRHIAFGAIADRYVTVDFTGRRFITLVETESSRWSDHVWNDGKNLYNVYRETIDFGAIESASIWYQNLPARQQVKCRLGPVTAYPMASATFKDPVLTVNGVTLSFPLELTSGSWIEGNGVGDCQVYGSKGEPLGKVTALGQWPGLRSGTNNFSFTCTSLKQPQPRIKVTVFCLGDAL